MLPLIKLLGLKCPFEELPGGQSSQVSHLLWEWNEDIQVEMLGRQKRRPWWRCSSVQHIHLLSMLHNPDLVRCTEQGSAAQGKSSATLHEMARSVIRSCRFPHATQGEAPVAKVACLCAGTECTHSSSSVSLEEVKGFPSLNGISAGLRQVFTGLLPSGYYVYFPKVLNQPSLQHCPAKYLCSLAGFFCFVFICLELKIGSTPERIALSHGLLHKKLNGKKAWARWPLARSSGSNRMWLLTWGKPAHWNDLLNLASQSHVTLEGSLQNIYTNSPLDPKELEFYSTFLVGNDLVIW